MPYREKGAWVYLVVTVGAFVVYAAVILGRADGRPLADVAYVAPMLWTIGLSIVASTIVRFVLTLIRAEYFWIANAIYAAFVVWAVVSIGRQARRVPTGAVVGKPTKVTNSIRALRFAHGEMTQAELAARIDVTRQTIIAIEQGRYSPSLEMAFQIARVFNLPVEEVFRYSE